MGMTMVLMVIILMMVVIIIMRMLIMIMMTLMIAFMVARIEDPEETLFVLAGEFQVRI